MGGTKMRVAVVCIAGTYCPVTQGHVGCLVEARNMLMKLPTGCAADKVKAPRPVNLEVYDLVLGFIRTNSDSYTFNKMQKKGCPEAFIPAVDRRMLINSAAKDHCHDWLAASEDYAEGLKMLASAYPEHEFTRWGLDGADVAV